MNVMKVAFLIGQLEFPRHLIIFPRHCVHNASVLKQELKSLQETLDQTINEKDNRIIELDTQLIGLQKVLTEKEEIIENMGGTTNAIVEQKSQEAVKKVTEQLEALKTQTNSEKAALLEEIHNLKSTLQNVCLFYIFNDNDSVNLLCC